MRAAKTAGHDAVEGKVRPCGELLPSLPLKIVAVIVCPIFLLGADMAQIELFAAGPLPVIFRGALVELDARENPREQLAGFAEYVLEILERASKENALPLFTEACADVLRKVHEERTGLASTTSTLKQSFRVRAGKKEIL
jgi:hypothetical protein